MPKHRVRRNGCSPPIKRDQIVSVLNVLLISIVRLEATNTHRAIVFEKKKPTSRRQAFVTILATVFANDPTILICTLVPYVAILLTSICLWVAAEMIDPATEGCGGLPCFSHSESRYDREMGRNIPGLDHHCKWLNTAISRRNYGIFFALVVCTSPFDVVSFVITSCVLIVFRRVSFSVADVIHVPIYCRNRSRNWESRRSSHMGFRTDRVA